MPLYDMHCGGCGATREVRVDHTTRGTLELICVGCGEVMRAAPISCNVALLRPPAQQEASAESGERQRRVKSCGHTYHCRCAIKLTRPNPFREQIDVALDEAD